jgi:hypothetical protein
VPKFIVERDIPGGGRMSGPGLRAISRRYRSVLRGHGPVTDDKVYCVYIAPSAAHIRNLAERGGFPVNCGGEVKAIIDPATTKAHPKKEGVRE